MLKRASIFVPSFQRTLVIDDVFIPNMYKLPYELQYFFYKLYSFSSNYKKVVRNVSSIYSKQVGENRAERINFLLSFLYAMIKQREEEKEAEKKKKQELLERELKKKEMEKLWGLEKKKWKK
ncbi:MAG: hypothetical protein ACK4F0_08560 [Candidatus Ratteibacteria bacterium]